MKGLSLGIAVPEVLGRDYLVIQSFTYPIWMHQRYN
jgi:hypothetical protein